MKKLLFLILLIPLFSFGQMDMYNGKIRIDVSGNMLIKDNATVPSFNNLDATSGWVAQYDPSLSNGTGGFDATKYASRAAYLKNMTSGTLSQGIVSANKVIDHLSTFLKDSSSLPVGAVNPFNINAHVSVNPNPVIIPVNPLVVNVNEVDVQLEEP